MLSLRFEGWFQCRLATNPDPSDEPRGVSGTTLALAGEPDLDGLIRFQTPVALRSHSPTVGVQVVGVMVDGMPRAGHPLLGAAVNLLEGPRFEERNGILAKPGEAPIDPFKIEIAGNGVVLRREDVWDPRRPGWKIFEVPPDMLRRRQPVGSGRPFEMASPEVADATGIADFPGYFRERRAVLEKELEGTLEPVAKIALRKRIAEIDQGGWLRHFRLGFRIEYSFEINGRPEVIDEQRLLDGKVLTSLYWLPRWPIRFWMGGFDSDTLCAYLKGTLDVPFAAGR